MSKGRTGNETRPYDECDDGQLATRREPVIDSIVVGLCRGFGGQKRSLFRSHGLKGKTHGDSVEDYCRAASWLTTNLTADVWASLGELSRTEAAGVLEDAKLVTQD